MTFTDVLDENFRVFDFVGNQRGKVELALVFEFRERSEEFEEVGRFDEDVQHLEF